MKLLVDTSVWSLALRRKDPASLSPAEQKLKSELTQAIRDGRVAMIGPIRQELLSGIKEREQFEKVRSALAPFVDEPIRTVDYEFAAQIYNACRSHGFEVGPIDTLICATVARHRWQLLSSDNGLNRSLAVARPLQTRHAEPSGEEVGRSRPSSRKTRPRI